MIPAAVIVAILGAALLPFLRALPRATATRFVIAGAIYVGVALLMELPLGYWTERHGADNPIYALIDWAEETLELCGAALLLLALGDHRPAGE